MTACVRLSTRWVLVLCIVFIASITEVNGLGWASEHSGPFVAAVRCGQKLHFNWLGETNFRLKSLSRTSKDGDVKAGKAGEAPRV